MKGVDGIYTDFTKKIIFSDEKEFNLDGPDGVACYWHDLRAEERMLSTRHQGRHSVMILTALFFYSRSYLLVFSGNMDSSMYCHYFGRNLSHFAP